MSTPRLLDLSQHSSRLFLRAHRDPEVFGGAQFLVDGCVTGAELSRPTVAIVGSRRPTAYGLRFVREFVPQLKGLGWNVISGGALGIDGEVHAAALRHEVDTQAYVVGPLARPSPRAHAELFRELRRRPGCALFVPDTLEPAHRGREPSANDWLLRNQWLVACADALVVVEAQIPSGTWSSVRIANSYAIPVFALPGPIFSSLSGGTNSMISNGYAHMILSVEELMQSLVVELGGASYNRRVGSGLEHDVTGGESNDLRTDHDTDHPELRPKVLNCLRKLLNDSQGLELERVLLRGVEEGLPEVEILKGIQTLLELNELVKSGNRLERRGTL